MAHACLFVGPAGIGKLRLARELAAVLLCARGSEDRTDACGVCSSCRAFAAGAHPDYEEVGVPAGKQKLPIDLVREICDQASLKPAQSSRRVFVIRDAERMNLQAANCFLKTLEEPPGACVFILIASSLRDLPPTVLSRCQIVRLRSLSAAQVKRRLAARGMPDREALYLAQRSWGSPGLAEQFAQMRLFEFSEELSARLLAADPAQNFDLSDWVAEQARRHGADRQGSREALQHLLECAAVLYRDVATAAAAGPQTVLCNEHLRDRLHQEAGQQPLSVILERCDRVFDAIERVGGNTNWQLTLDDLFTRLSLPEQGS